MILDDHQGRRRRVNRFTMRAMSKDGDVSVTALNPRRSIE